MDVTAIVISYNSEGRISDAVRAHEEALSALSAEIIVVDNASSDASVSIARNTLTRGYVIANEENVGYGAAANQAIRRARGRYCLVMNDDARLEPGAAELMVEVLSADDTHAMVGPRIVDEAGNPMPSARLTYPGPKEEWERLVSMLRGIDRNNFYWAQSEPMEVAWLVGACIMARTDLLRKVGGFNPAFFLYSEDIDLAKRIHDHGFKILTIPGAVCVHTGSVSTGVAYGWRTSIDRRSKARDIYYRIWCARATRALIHLLRAFGFRKQPARLVHHVPQIFWDGRSLAHLRRLQPLAEHIGEGAIDDESGDW